MDENARGLTLRSALALLQHTVSDLAWTEMGLICLMCFGLVTFYLSMMRRLGLPRWR